MVSAYTYNRPRSRQSTALAAVTGLHVLLGMALVLGTSRQLLPPVTIPVGPITPARDTPPERHELPLPVPDYVAPQLSVPSETAVVVKGPVPDTLAESRARPVPDATVQPKPQPAAVTPVQMTAAGRQRLADSCSERYPAAARRLGQEGVVRILVYVAADGRATDARIEESSGYPLLDAANIACVKAAGQAFVAQRSGNAAIGAWQLMTYRWQLN